MLDYLIRGATVVDGAGAPAFAGDVGVHAGLIVSVGPAGTPAATVLDATGLVVTPGFVDPHCHYDARLCWDPYATPSNLHGVTTIMNGNCGFTLAPLRPADADYIRRMMTKVEGMSLAALETGVRWSWETFAEYLEALRGRIAEGYWADLVVFDPDRIGSQPASLAHDLPTDSPRLTAASTGVVRVLVNGVETVRDGAATGATPGTVLRSGHDTATVTAARVPVPR